MNLFQTFNSELGLYPCVQAHRREGIIQSAAEKPAIIKQ